MFTKIKEAILGKKAAKSTVFEWGQEIVLRGQEVIIPHRALPMELELGGNGSRLHLYPEAFLGTVAENKREKVVFILEPVRYFAGTGATVALEEGDNLLVGRHDPMQLTLFGFGAQVALRHASVTNTGDTLVVRDLNSDTGTRLIPLRKPGEITKLVGRRQAALHTIREIYGGPIQLLPPGEALALIQQVNRLMAQEPCRPLDSRQLPGGLVELPEKITPIVVGDLHTQVNHLLKILSEDGCLNGLEKGSAALVILGDAVHSEEMGELDRMEGSALIMDLIFKLKLRYPENLFYIRGNHDSFAPELRKGGIPQGTLWEQYLFQTRGEAYVQEMRRYYSALPYLAMGKSLLACHAAPPRSHSDRELFIDIYRYPGLREEITQNRMNSPARSAGYTKGDIKRLRKGLNLPAEIPFIVGHTPLSRDKSVWMNAGGMEHHHVVFSGMPQFTSILTLLDGQLLPLTYPAENLMEVINQLEPPTPRKGKKG